MAEQLGGESEFAEAFLRSSARGQHVGQTEARLRFTCMVRPGLERVTLALKRQLEEVGVEVTVEEAPLNSIMQSMARGSFEAVLTELISGPNLFRPHDLALEGVGKSRGPWWPTTGRGPGSHS
jgi:hypothetical protein